MSEEAEQLLQAIFNQHDLEALKFYIAKGYDVCTQLHQNTLLHAAASMIESALAPEVAIIRVLFERGIAIDARDQYGQTALMRSKSAVIAAMLHARGADIHAECNLKMTALHYAASRGNAAVVQILLDAGASAAAICQRHHFP
jgi:ankyrin repeat protein